MESWYHSTSVDETAASLWKSIWYGHDTTYALLAVWDMCVYRTLRDVVQVSSFAQGIFVGYAIDCVDQWLVYIIIYNNNDP